MTADMTADSRWWEYRPVITAVDLLASGACIDGVKKAVEAVGLSVQTRDHAKNPHAVKAAHGDDSGYGCGYGYGDGYGDGSGYGYGYGCGDG